MKEESDLDRASALLAEVRSLANDGSTSSQALSFELQTYGIPTEPMFSENTANADNLEWHHEWLDVIRAKEQSESTHLAESTIPKRVECLRKNAREHTGNRRALHLCEMVRPQYEQVSKLFETTAIAERIVNSIRDSHGRFLKWEDDGWVEVDTETAREKRISHFFRHHRSKTSYDTSNNQRTSKRKNESLEPDMTLSGMEKTHREGKQPFRPADEQSIVPNLETNQADWSPETK